MALSVNEITEAFLESMKVIADETVEKNPNSIFEKATITDASNHDRGIYTVYNGSAKYVATCANNTNLIEGMQVLVLIQNGDFSGEKIIMDRCLSPDTSAELLDSPLSRCILSNNDLIEYSILDNKNSADIIPNNTFKQGEINEKEQIEIFTINNLVNDASFQRNQYIGISADFKTAMTNLSPITGNYGITVEITYLNENNIEIKRTYNLTAKTEMIGNIYNFNTYFPQAALYELEEYPILNIYAYLFQDNDFSSADEDISQEDFKSSGHAISVQNISIKFGKDSDADSELDEIQLVSKDALVYDMLASDSENQKSINVKWQFRNKESTKYWEINNTSDFKEAVNLDIFKIHWYRDAFNKTSSDILEDFDKKSIYYINIDTAINEFLTYYDDNKNKVIEATASEETLTTIAKNFNSYYAKLGEVLGQNSFVTRYLPNGFAYMILSTSGYTTAQNIQKQKDSWTEEKKKLLEKMLRLGGEHWMWIEDNENKFNYPNFIPDKSMPQDRVKVVIEYGTANKDGTLNESNSSYRRKESFPIVFANKTHAYVEEKQANFTIIPEDGSDGKYYIYSTDDSLLIDRGDSTKERTLNLSFIDNNTNLLQLSDLIIWKLPKSDKNTMLNFTGTFGGTDDKKGKVLNTISDLNKLLIEKNVTNKAGKNIDASYFLNVGENFDDFYFIQRNFIFDDKGKVRDSVGVVVKKEYDDEGEEIKNQRDAKQIEYNNEEKYLEELRKIKQAKGTPEEAQITEPPLAKGGWVKEKGLWYFHQEIKDLEEKQRYISTGVKGDTKVKAVGWRYIKWEKGTNWFYFDSSGVMVTGWREINYQGNKEWFYLNSNGAMLTGWHNLDYKGSKDWYYFDTFTGVMAKNKNDIDANLTFSTTKDKTEGSLIKIESLTITQKIQASERKLKNLEGELNTLNANLEKHEKTADEIRLKALGSQSYYINPFYNSYLSNNKIQAYIIKPGLVLESSLVMQFGQSVLNVSDYNFLIRFGPLVKLVDNKFSIVENSYDVALTIPETAENTVNYREIIFEIYGPDNKPISLTNEEKNAIIEPWAKGLESGFFSGFDKKNNLRFISEEENGLYTRIAIRPVRTLQNKRLTISDFTNIVLQAKYEEQKLTQLFPIHVRQSYSLTNKDNVSTVYNQHYILGSEFIVYNDLGINPRYCTEGFKLINQNNGKEITGRISFADHNFDDFVTIDKMKINPKANWEENKKSSGIIFERHSTQTKTEKKDGKDVSVTEDVWTPIYTFPLSVLKNRFQIALIDEREYSLMTPITGDTNVVSSVLTSGNTNQNSFTGVVVGNVQNTSSSTSQPTTSTGLFGYIDGKPSYGFSNEGTAFIGRDSFRDAAGNITVNNGGKIEFSSSGGLIESGNPSYGTQIDLTKGTLKQTGVFTLIGHVSDELKVNTPSNGAGSRILFKKDDAAVDIGLWYYPSDQVTHPFFRVKNDKLSLIFDKNNFYIQTSTLAGNTNIIDKIDIKKGEINFNEKFKVNYLGDVYCGNLTGQFNEGTLGNNLKIPTTESYKPNNLGDLIRDISQIRSGLNRESLEDLKARISELMNLNALSGNNLFIDFTTSRNTRIYGELISVIKDFEARLYALENK